MEKRAIGKYLSGSARKARLVVDQIRGLNAHEAVSLLKFSQKRAARAVEKILRSAIANAVNSEGGADADRLTVSSAFVDMGPTKWRRRVRPAPMGRAYRQRRHGCHITITVSDER